MKTLHTIYTNFAKRLALVLTLLITLGVTTAWAAVYTYDCTSNKNFYTDAGLTTNPSTGSSNTFAENASFYAEDGACFTVLRASKVYFNSGYLMVGNYQPVLQLPTYANEKITKVKFWNSSGCSTSVKVTIKSGSNTAAAQQTWSNKGSSYTYNISETYQSSTLKLDVTSANAQITKIEITTSAACANSVDVSAGSRTNVNSISFSSSSIATCSSIATDRQVTITVTPNTGYEMTNGARLTFTKTSGTATATYVSGPTESGSSYKFVYRFTQNDNGAGTFSAICTAKQYTITLNNQSATTAGTTSVTATYNANTNLTTAITTPTKTGYTFGGYYTSTNGSGTQLIDADGNFIAKAGGGSTYTDADKIWKYANNITLYAKWTARALTNYRTSCSYTCTDQYTFDYGGVKLCFSQVDESNEYQITDFTIPETTTNYWVGYNGYFYDSNLGTSGAKSANNQFKYLPIAYLQHSNCEESGYQGESYQYAMQGAYGKLRIYDNYPNDNLFVGFIPAGYQMRYGTGENWANFQLFGNDKVWTSEVMDITAELVAKYYYINIYSGATFNANDAGVAINHWTDGSSLISSMQRKTNNGDNWANGVSAGMRGFFRTWVDNCYANGYCHFVPTHRIVYVANWPAGATGVAPSDSYSEDVSVEESKEITLQAAPTAPAGYIFSGWYDAPSGGNLISTSYTISAGATADITLYAQWTETNYTLTHSGSNYTNTQNKTTIKSSETPLTLNYTCTGDYGLPATISITGGGKSWTVGTDYTWEVAADRQSAILVIKETVISANVTITINVATRYTVTFIHNDKGVFSGSETIEVLSSENTITLPTVTDVSCGFYDTFEGWIVSNDEYVESTTKPATVYAGGASYRVTGDCTFRALYSKCEGDAKQVYRKVTSTGEVTDGTYILVATTTTGTSYVYSGNGGNTYGLYVSGLTTDAGDFSSELPQDADPITISIGSGSNAGKFAMYNANEEKYLTYTSSGSNTLNTADSEAFVWYLTDGSQKINGTDCPQGALTPSDDARVLQLNASATRFACYKNTATYPYVFLYKLIDKCTKYYSTNPSCEKPVGVRIVYHANAVDANMSCETQRRTYKVENEENKYPQLASQLQFCKNATREGYTLVGWNTQENGQGTTYNINQNYYRLPVSGELDDEKWITLNLYAMWKQSVKFDLGNATGGTGVPDAIVENSECVLPEPTAEQLGTIPCAYEFYAWSETSVNATQSKPTVWMPGDTYTGSATTLYAVYRLCETGSNADLFSLSYTISGTKYYVGPVLDTRENRSTKFSAVTNENDATVFGMKSVEGQTYKSLFWVDSEGNNKYMYWKDYGASFQFTSEEDDSYGWTVTGTTKLTFVSTPYMTKGSRYLSADATEIGCPSDPKAVTQFTKEMASTMICTYATEPECSTTATLQFVTNGGTLNYPASYSEINYQDLTIGTTVYLPTATFAGEWEFEGWLKGSALESQTMRPETTNFIEVELNTTTYTANATGTTTFYAVYSKTNDDKQFDPVNGGTYKLFAIGADGTKTYMPVWTGTRGTPSGVTTCAETGDYTITPGTGTHAGQYQITCGEYTLGVVSGNTDLNRVEGTWWNIEPSTSGKGTWRITVAGSTDDRALSCSFSTAKSFGNYAISNLNNPSQSIYRDMEIGECIYTEYTSTPENIPYITITGAPVKITSTNGERVYASTTVHIEAHNFTGERIIHLSATNGFGVDPVQVRTNGQGAYSGDVKVYYEPTTDGDGQTFTTSVLSASQTGGTNAEKISQTFAAIQGRNMPANFVIAAKWDGHWYALPANCTSSLSSTEGLLIEVDDVDNPTRATQAPASAKYGIREVIPSRQTDHGQGIVFTERFAEGDKQFALYNGSDANIQVNAQYSNYAQKNPDKYEWIPTTSDFNEYTVTNASTGRNLGLTSGSFGAYTAASNQVRLLPATFYEPAPVQVLKWKANSVIVMYTGAEATATTQVGNNDASDKQTLADQKITHGIYELTTNQALTSNTGGVLKLNFGANTRVELEIPLIISGEVTASANAHDVVILENSKLTADATKYSYKDVYVYGGGKLAVPASTSLGVNNIILRAGGIATDGAGQNATYQYIYPQVELKGTLTSSVQNIRYEYVTDYDHWYHLVLPFDGSLASIHYPYEYYGDQVKLDNEGSWIIKRYAGEIRATGNYDAWKDIEKDEPKATIVTAGKGYIFWGAPKKITANDVYDRPTWGIQRITMSVSAPDAKRAENGDKTIEDLGSYANVANNSKKVNDQGWNLIGNPYMVNLTTMAEDGLKAGKLEKEIVDGNWTGKWFNNGDDIRYLTIPSDHFDTYEAKTVSAAKAANNLVPGRAFFVQLEGEADGVTFAAANRASLMPALRAANDKPVDIETGIVLSNETLQDEVNFWIKAGKTNDYEYNADYPKTPNNNQFNIYGVHTNGDLSWVATGPEYAAESMPIGYQVPAAGTYMLSLSEIYNSDGLDALYITDHALSPEVTVDIISEPYEFSVNQAETNNERFTVSVRVKAKTENGATGLGNVGADGEQIHKFIYQDKMYILHHGVIYDATGKRVITINK